MGDDELIADIMMRDGLTAEQARDRIQRNRATMAVGGQRMRAIVEASNARIAARHGTPDNSTPKEPTPLPS